MLLLNDAVPIQDEKYEAELRQKYQDEDWLFEASRRDIIRRTFLATADATYVTARWQFFNKLNFEFLWNASHAVEKYLKAALLMNNVKVRDLKHDIHMAFERAQENFGTDLLPTDFPSALTARISHIVSGDQLQRLRHDGAKAYVRNLNQQGGVEARYAMRGHVIPTTDLYCLDLTAFLIRRLVENLQLPNKADELQQSPEVCPTKDSLLENIYAKDDHPLRSTLGKVNYYLNPTPDTSRALQISALGMSASNSALYNNIVERAQSGNPSSKAASKRLARWTLDYLPGIKPYQAELQQYL
jgi:hypothetical protein